MKDSLQQEIEGLKFNHHQTMQNVEDQKENFYEKIDSFKFENKTLQGKLGERVEEIQKLKQQLTDIKGNIDEKVKDAVNVANQQAQEKVKLLQIQLDQMKREGEDQLKLQIEARKNHEYTLQKQSDKLLIENENLLRMLNEEKLKSIDISKKLNEEISNQKSKNLEYQITISTQQKEIEGQKSQQGNWNILFKEKMDIVNTERDKLLEKICTKKHKYQVKLKEVKEGMERKNQILQEDLNSQIRQYEQIMRELRIENEKISLQYHNQQTLLSEKERKYQRDVEELEDKFRTFRKNQEQTFKQQLNDRNITEFHLKSKNEENQKYSKENLDLKERVEQLSKNLRDIEAENELLMQEIVKYRKSYQQNQNNQLDVNQDILNKQKKKTQQNAQKGKKKIQLNSSMQFEEDKSLSNHKKDTIQNDSNILQQQEEAESYEKLFSDDMGPVSPMRSKNFNLEFLINSILLKNKLNTQNHNTSQQHHNNSNQMKNNQQPKNNSKLLEKISAYESEIEAYNHIIETLALEMENVNKESQRIKSENTDLKQRIGGLQMDVMNYREKLLKSDLIQRSAFEKDQELDEKEKEIQKIQKRVDKYKSEIEKLKRDSEQLVSISSELRVKLREHEDLLEQKDKVISGYKDNYIFINKFDMKNPKQMLLSQLDLATEQGSKQLGSNENVMNPLLEVNEKEQSPNQRTSTNKTSNKSQSPNRYTASKHPTSNQSNQQLNNQQNSNQKSNQKPTQIDKHQQKKPSDGSQKVFKKSFPKYDNFQDIEDFLNKNIAGKSQKVNNIFQKQDMDDDNQYYDENVQQNLFVKSNTKPLLDRYDDDKQAQYIPNSLKATPSQIENEKKMKELKKNSLTNNQEINSTNTQKGQSPQKGNEQQASQPPKVRVRNYSIKDEDLN